MMELLCLETQSAPRGIFDAAFMDDERVLANLQKVESSYLITCKYFERVQTELEPYMRKTVADWMLDVCAFEKCEDEVFPLSMNFMDRFLCLVNIRKSQLQLLGSVCLLLASKLRQSRPISVESLVTYTDYSVTVEEIKGWEILVLSKLKWDLGAITPNDFLNLLLRRLQPIISKNEETLIRKHAQTFIELCSTDEKFIGYPPSLIAAASLQSAMEGLRNLPRQHLQRQILDQIQNRQFDFEKIILAQLSRMIERTCEEKAAFRPVQPNQSNHSHLPLSPPPSNESSLPGSPRVGDENSPINVISSLTTKTGKSVKSLSTLVEKSSPSSRQLVCNDPLTGTHCRTKSLITEQVK